MAKWEEAKVTKTDPCLIGPPLGAPGFIFIEFGLTGYHFGTFVGARGTQNSMKINPQTNWAGVIDESSNRPDCSAVAGLTVRQLDNRLKSVGYFRIFFLS